jgi:hypothetical protein
MEIREDGSCLRFDPGEKEARPSKVRGIGVAIRLSLIFGSGPLWDYDSIHANPIIAEVRGVRPAEPGIAWLFRAYAHGKHHQ